jgi:putative DNA primase/helicase
MLTPSSRSAPDQTRHEHDVTLEACREMLQHIDPGLRSNRVRAGEALKDEFGDAAFEVFDGWYSTHTRYTAAEAKQAWRSFGKGGGKPCTIGTLIYEAQRGGFKFAKQHQIKRTPDERARAQAQKQARRKALEEEAAAEAAAAAARAQAIWDAADQDPASHGYLARKGIQAIGVRRAREWVKEWTDPESGEVVTYTHADPLLVPIWSAPRKLASLQAIFATKTIGRKPRDDERDERRDKDYLAGGAKRGCYFALGKIKPDTDLVLVCEGYATGASLHEAEGAPVMVAFDAGNLEPVAAMVRGKLPNARIVICADNDRFTARPDGSAWNPGVELATKAAESCNGVVAVPQFDENVPGQPTDFNDLHALCGLGPVRQIIEKALEHSATIVLAPDQINADRVPVALAPQAMDRSTVVADGEEDAPERNSHFVILGNDCGTYFVFKHATGQIIKITKRDLTEAGLIELASLNWWEMSFPGGRPGSINKATATEFIIRTAEKRGIYDPGNVRGRGAWIDGDRIVYHHGAYLTVDGRRVGVAELKSGFVYPAARSLPEPHSDRLTADNGAELLHLLRQFRWNVPGSALLFAGWIALAPVCGALPWRPHIWISGPAGCGKTTLASLANKLLLGTAVYAGGGSTEPGVRRMLGEDALPVLMDESEAKEDSDVQRVRKLLGLIRQASSESGAVTLMGGADGKSQRFNVRSMFCLASITVAKKDKADLDRLTTLTLRGQGSHEAGDVAWVELRDKMHALVDRDKTVAHRLLRRCIDLLPTTIKNIEVFTDAAAKRFGAQRQGDQFGTLLAGAWSLTSDEVATEAKALALIDSCDWSEHRDGAEEDDSRRAMNALLAAVVRMDSGATYTLSDLISMVSGRYCSEPGEELIAPKDARKKLGHFGMKVDDVGGRECLFVGNENAERDRVMAATPYKVGVKGLLLRLPGAMTGEKATGKKTNRFPGGNSQGFFVVPLDSVFIPDDRGGDPEPPF